MKPDDGGPAFPGPDQKKLTALMKLAFEASLAEDKAAMQSVSEQLTTASCPGMSLRDWFAGQALMVIAIHFNPPDNATTAKWAYTMADAMLAERAKEWS